MWPATLTTLVEEVALHHLLGGDDGNFGSVFEFESSLCGLDEGDGVARTTFALVTHRSSKVIAVYVSEIVGVGNLGVRNFLGSVVLLSPFLCLVKGFFE